MFANDIFLFNQIVIEFYPSFSRLNSTMSDLIFLQNILVESCYSFIHLFIHSSRENYGCHQLIRTSFTTTDGDHCSLPESRQSMGSTKIGQRRRSTSEYHRAHNPRVLTPTLPVPPHRQSNYRTPTSIRHARTASKRIVQHQNSQASLLYGYQHHH